MSRLAMCGWESGHHNEIGLLSFSYNSPWSATMSSYIVTAARNGNYGYGLRLGTPDGGYAALQRVVPLVSNPSEVYMRCALANAGLLDGASANHKHSIFAFHDGLYQQVALGLQGGDTALRLYRYQTEIANGGAVPGATYICVEMYVKIHSESGQVTVWQDGTRVIDFTGNTQYTANVRVTDFRFGSNKWAKDGNEVFRYHAPTFDDLAINDTAGSVNNGRIGQGGIFALRPTADTSEKDWTPSTGTDNFARVNSAPPVGDASYVSAGNSGDLDLYELPNFSGGEIDAVMAMVVSRVASGAGREISPVLRSGAVTAIGSTYSLTNTYSVQTQIYNTDPNTGAAWTLTAVNSAQCGVAITT